MMTRTKENKRYLIEVFMLLHNKMMREKTFSFLTQNNSENTITFTFCFTSFILYFDSYHDSLN